METLHLCNMTGKRINIPAILMVMAILAIIAFQSYWMYKNYEEEEKTLQIRSAAIFRNVAYKMQADKLQEDTSFTIWTSTRPSHAGTKVLPSKTIFPMRRLRDTAESSLSGSGDRIFINAFPASADSHSGFQRSMPLDSIKTDQIRAIDFQRRAAFSRVRETRTDSGVTITINNNSDASLRLAPVEKMKGRISSIDIKTSEPARVVTGIAKGAMPAKMNLRTNGKDTVLEYMVLSRLMEDGSFQSLLQRADSISDTLSLDELGKRFREALLKESMILDFSIEKDSLSYYAPNTIIDPTRTNELMMGYSSTYFLRYHLLNSFQYITRKLSPQIGLSLLLIALTSFTFVLLYRNMMKQRRLTQFKNDLISNITHELKTPIATVSVAIEALKSFHAMDDPRRTEEYLDISNSELQRLSLLVDKVLRLSMFEKHQVELKKERFDLRLLTEEVISSLRLQFEKVKADVHLQADGEDLSIEADRLHITSVIFNLLDNALKYGKENPVITVSISRNESGLQFTVSDNGIGIPAAYRKKVFDKFFRVPSGDTHNVKGYGLGLSYVAYVVERHKGKIEVLSEPGQGSSFIIQLPDPI
ncbi:phospho-acceptor domain-containing protein [Pseudobacter ginsenosidimutans]|uniref:histidine kinase n=2 Tax=Pseudobacter ginsenosidimutans TaxID=661488 RepID=A0A4Q7MSY0_9BACT|nr:HAMP domain-containing histidine kinase [Pseudobacter ginsenosidimutans]RZS71915.1 phospho-acceptor domain-containing protein [Pseudobacter ginsenosidimutans]